MPAVDNIHEACSAGDVAAVQRLLEAEPEAASQEDEAGCLPLHVAARSGHAAVVQLLLEAAPEVVQLLLEAAPAAAVSADLEGRLPLHVAAAAGHAAAVQMLLQAAPAAALAADSQGGLPLHLAAVVIPHSAAEAVVRLLLDAAPAAAATANLDGWLPLHFAAVNDNAAVVRMLLDAAPEAATAADDNGWLPLHLAASYGRTQMVHLLLARAPQTAAAVRGDRTALQHALQEGHSFAARALLGAGPADAGLSALVAAGDDALPLFPDFLLAPGRLPLAAAHWARIPSPCPGIEHALPAALACGSFQAAQVVHRMAPADIARLRTAALCMCRQGLPGTVAAPILAHCI